MPDPEPGLNMVKKAKLFIKILSASIANIVVSCSDPNEVPYLKDINIFPVI